MKKFLVIIGTVLFSLIITFVTFEALSWYHFGDIPTKVVFFRLIVFFFIIEGLSLSILAIVNKFKNK